MLATPLDTSMDLLEKIYSLQKESAVSDALIKKDVEHLTENVKTITEKIDTIENRIDRQDVVLTKLADQYNEIKCNKEAIKNLNERLGKVEQKPYENAYCDSEERKKDRTALYRTIRNTAITVFVSGIVGSVTGFIIALAKGAN